MLGPGAIAARHAAATRANGLELVGICGRDRARTAAFASEHGGEPFTDLDRMIDSAAPELLIVALPPFVREGEIEHAASPGLHLLVEKPLALDMATADRIGVSAQTTAASATSTASATAPNQGMATHTASARTVSRKSPKFFKKLMSCLPPGRPKGSLRPRGGQ